MPVAETAPVLQLSRHPAGVMIGTPMYGGQCFDYYLLGVYDLQRECYDRGITLALHTIRNESLIHRARNRILADFLDSACSHLVFIDADIGFSGRDVLRLVAHDKPLVGATYAKKNRHRYDPAFHALPHGVVVTGNELVEIQCLPGGFMCISRDTAQRMGGAFRDLWYRDSNRDSTPVLDLFAPYIDRETRNMWSEDYAFCQRWRELGGQVFLDPNIQLTHSGTTVFEGDPRAVFINPPEPAPAVAAPSLRVSPAGKRKARAALGKLGARK
jgi:hypothetical protein